MLSSTSNTAWHRRLSRDLHRTSFSSLSLSYTGPLLDRIRRQLQHFGLLSRDEIGDQDDCAIRKFQRVMMTCGLIGIYLTKSRQRVCPEHDTIESDAGEPVTGYGGGTRTSAQIEGDPGPLAH